MRWRRQPFEPMLIDADHVTPCYAYREQRGERDRRGLRPAPRRRARGASGTGRPRDGDRLRRRAGGRRHLGAVPAVARLFPGDPAVCDRHGMLLILDEVMCGMGRTGTLFACEQDGVRPDLIAVAKGLGAGYQPIGAMLVHERIYARSAHGSGFFQHGHTYMGHPTACAAGLAVQQTIEDERPARAGSRPMGDAARAGLSRALRQPPPCRRHPRPRPVPRPRAGRRPRQQGALRPGPGAERPDQARGAWQTRPDVLPDGRHHRRPQAATTSSWPRPSSSTRATSRRSPTSSAAPSTRRSPRSTADGRSRRHSGQSAKGSRTRMVSSRSGLVESRATGASTSSSSRLTYLTAGAGRSAKLRAPRVLSDQPSSSS